MHKCVMCGADTILFVNGVPYCVECDEQREKQAEPHPATKAQDGLPLASVRPHLRMDVKAR